MKIKSEIDAKIADEKTEKNQYDVHSWKLFGRQTRKNLNFQQPADKAKQSETRRIESIILSVRASEE